MWSRVLCAAIPSPFITTFRHFLTRRQLSFAQGCSEKFTTPLSLCPVPVRLLRVFCGKYQRASHCLPSSIHSCSATLSEERIQAYRIVIPSSSPPFEGSPSPPRSPHAIIFASGSFFRPFILVFLCSAGYYRSAASRVAPALLPRLFQFVSCP